MQIRVNGGENVRATEALGSSVSAYLEKELARFAGQITRVEVHMSDENAEKGGGDDKRCTVEARVEGRPPYVVTEKAPTMRQAMTSATEKLYRLIEHDLARLHDRSPGA
jgi:ribosomal subunit interface protein